MNICPTCGTPNEADDHFCGQCGGTLGQPNPPAAVGAAPPRQLAIFAGLLVLMLILLRGVGVMDWLAGQIRQELIPSLRQVSPFSLIAAFDLGMRCTDYWFSWFAVHCGATGPFAGRSSWIFSPGQALHALAYTASQVLNAGWPVWILVFPPLGAGIPLWRRLGLGSFGSPIALLFGIPALFLACGVVSWVVQLLLVIWILPLVAQLLLVLGGVAALYAWWREITGIVDDLRTALRVARIGSGLTGRPGGT